MTREVPLSDGRVALVDDEDYSLVSGLVWTPEERNDRVYARNIAQRLYMHRLLLGDPPGDIDHENRNGLDNRRSNLRLATRSQNNLNSRRIKGSFSSRFKGVSWRKDRQWWIAYITKDGHREEIGHFTDEVVAAKARDARAVELFGEFARLNFPRT